MKPFDLAAAKAGADVVTRDGRKVLQLFHFDKAQGDLPVHAIIEGDGLIRNFSTSGSWDNSGGHNLDLFMATKEREAWVNLYKGGEALWCESEELADRLAGLNRLGGKAHRITWEE